MERCAYLGLLFLLASCQTALAKRYFTHITILTAEGKAYFSDWILCTIKEGKKDQGSYMTIRPGGSNPLVVKTKNALWNIKPEVQTKAFEAMQDVVTSLIGGTAPNYFVHFSDVVQEVRQMRGVFEALPLPGKQKSKEIDHRYLVTYPEQTMAGKLNTVLQPTTEVGDHKVWGDYIKIKVVRSENNLPVKVAQKDPTLLWNLELTHTHTVEDVTFDVPAVKAPDTVRFVFMSDTHELHDQVVVPEGDVFIFTGDLTNFGNLDRVRDFKAFLDSDRLKSFKYKIVIAGNHDLSFDPKCFQAAEYYSKVIIDKEKNKYELILEEGVNPRDILKDSCTYLEDRETVEVYGFKIYGSPWQPTPPGYKGREWAFTRERGMDMFAKWDDIPLDTDILLTHGPPIGYGDETLELWKPEPPKTIEESDAAAKKQITVEAGSGGSGSSGGSGEGRGKDKLPAMHVRGGDVDLLDFIENKLKGLLIHASGHIHEGYGVRTNGETFFINSSIVAGSPYVVKNLPVVVDIPLPNLLGRRKKIRTLNTNQPQPLPLVTAQH